MSRPGRGFSLLGAGGAAPAAAGMLALALAGGCAPSSPAAPAVAVTAVEPTGAGARAGLRPGDLVLSFRRRPAPPADPRGAAGPVRSAIDLAEAQIEQAPRGPVELAVRRGGRGLTLTLAFDDWRIALRSPAEAAEGKAWAAFDRAERLAGQPPWSTAQAAYEEARRRAAAVHRPLFEALVLEREGAGLVAQEDFPAAEEALLAAQSLRRAAAPQSLAEAASWASLARLEMERGRLDAAEGALQKAAALGSRLGPESLAYARVLKDLGLVAWMRLDLPTARSFYARALPIVERRAKGSLDEAKLLNNLGILAREAGDVSSAAALYTRAGALFETLEPAGKSLAAVLINLGVVAEDRGDLAGSEELYRRALARLEKLAPESLGVATVLTNLGQLARERRELAEAESYLRRGLAIRRKLVPGSLDEADSLSNLGGVAVELGRFTEAEELVRQALAIRRREAPGSGGVATSLGMLGTIADERNDLEAAGRLSDEALALFHRSTPGSLAESNLLEFVGNVAMRRKDWPKAESCLERSLAIRRRIAPQSRLEADAWRELGLFYRAAGRPARQAEAAFRAAIAALEGQIGRIGASEEAQTSFRERFTRPYQSLIELELAERRPAAAFHTLERSRAGALLTLLARRDLTWKADVPPEQLAAVGRLEHEYERTEEQLARLDPRKERAQLEAQRLHLFELRDDRSALLRTIFEAAPRYASLRAPKPLDLAGARASLDPGTVLLAYAVGEKQTFLFVVGDTVPAGLQVATLAAGRDQLAGDITQLRSLLLRGRDRADLEPVLVDQSRRLYDRLIAPAEPWLGRATRLLISPDGPLHTLPFAALVRPGATPTFLAQWKPLHSVLSATLYAELRRGRRRAPGPPGGLVAFADPLYAAANSASLEAAPGETPLRRYRRGLAPLPGAREEVATLALLYGRRAVTYVGAEATEERAKHLGTGPRYIHFALHAMLDPRSPLDSALALARPAAGSRENGLLQAWEIFEDMRLDADLVTLSACDTGLGRETAGEGLIGLTRAFQYAGARSILASLWEVDDRSTARLMQRFYTRLRAGQPKDLALQGAERDLLEGKIGGRPELLHPFHWAAFELIGDWQ